MSGEESNALRSSVPTGNISCGWVGVAASEVVDVVMRIPSVYNAATEIDVGVVMLPFRVVVVQQRTHYRKQQGVQGDNDAGLKHLCHYAFATNLLRCALPGVSDLNPAI